MKISDIFIKRPILALVVNLLILIAGLVSINTLSVRQYPRSDIAQVTIKTAYIGANADLVRGYITTPLERVIASADGIDYMQSSSAQGLSTITVRLKLNFDTNAALTQIQAKVAQVRNDLPPEAEAPVIEVESKDSEFAAIYLSFYSKDLDQNQITDYLTRVVQPKLSAIDGVQRADILGARTFAMRIWLKADKLASLNLTPTEVQAALQSNNYLAAVGRTKGSMIAVNLIANTDLKTVEEFRNLVIRQRDGAIVRLGDVADVSLGAESYEEDVRFSGQKATFMGVWPLPTANTLDVVRRVRDALPEIQSRLPAGMNASIAYDSTVYIDSAIHDVLKTLAETLIIVVIVIFLFMGSVRSVIIPIVAIPISLIGAVFLMMLAGFTINLLTLLAIVLAVGLVVDDAIVVVENVERHLQEGQSPFNAALLGARELVGPIISMTITLAAVYTPIGIQGGLTGALFREFAFTLAGAVIVSGIVALTLSPMMASKLLREGDAEKGFAGWINHRFAWMRKTYSRMLEATVSNRWPVLIFSGLMALLIFPLSKFSVNELAPNEDQGFLFGIVQAPANATLDQVSLFTDEINKAFMSAPEVANTFQINSAAGGFGGLVTKPWNERTRSTEEIATELFPKTGAIAGLQVIPITPAPLPGGSNFPIELVIASTAEPRELLEVANQLVAKAFASGVFMFADTDLKYDQPQTEIVFDRDKVASQGLNLQRVGADLGALLGGNYVNRFNTAGRSYKVIPQIKRTERLNADQLKDIYVSGPDGQMVQLSTFATLKNSVVARELKRFQQLNSATIQGAIPPGVSKDQALRVLEEEARRIMPPGFVIDYAGESRQLRTEGNTLVTTMMLSGVLIFLVLAAQFESFRDPFIIIIGSVPLALTGALVFAFLGFTSLNIYSQVGLITLVGLVSKNGILIVEFANHLQEQGLSKVQAVIQASAIRLRPILMTTAATVCGHTPLIFASGPGAAARNSIGIVLVTGMIIGTAFTLFVVPAIYIVIARDRSKAPTGLPIDREESLPPLKPAVG
ncbi:MAG TPA: efflux RND transporter permease subunit [Terrimicrobiaceae bacterium]|nr:efflux RND transporter permease subunit [Terrimicrobiaceae bacterium]